MFHYPHQVHALPMDGAQAQGAIILCFVVIAATLAVAGLLWLTSPKTTKQ